MSSGLKINLLEARTSSDDYAVNMGLEQLGIIRRYWQSDNEYWIIIAPLGDQRIFQGKSGAKRACYYVCKIVYPDYMDATSTW
jgi:hypothetical protein